MVDTLVLGASAARHEGSSPFIRTTEKLFSELPPVRAVFSRVLHSKTQMFLGGETVWAAAGCAFLVFSRHWRFLFGTIELHTSFEKAIFVGFNGRLVQSSLF